MYFPLQILTIMISRKAIYTCTCVQYNICKYYNVYENPYNRKVTLNLVHDSSEKNTLSEWFFKRICIYLKVKSEVRLMQFK